MCMYKTLTCYDAQIVYNAVVIYIYRVVCGEPTENNTKIVWFFVDCSHANKQMRTRSSNERFACETVAVYRFAYPVRTSSDFEPVTVSPTGPSTCPSWLLDVGDFRAPSKGQRAIRSSRRPLCLRWKRPLTSKITVRVDTRRWGKKKTAPHHRRTLAGRWISGRIRFDATWPAHEMSRKNETCETANPVFVADPVTRLPINRIRLIGTRATRTRRTSRTSSRRSTRQKKEEKN